MEERAHHSVKRAKFESSEFFERRRSVGAMKTKKKWWKPRPYTEADARIARKFGNCKTAEMF